MPEDIHDGSLAYGRPDKGTKKSKWKWLFAGMLSITPVTLNDSLSILSSLPIGSSVLKYLCAISFVSTILRGSINAVFELPFINGSVNTLKKLESTIASLLSLNVLL